MASSGDGQPLHVTYLPEGDAPMTLETSATLTCDVNGEVCDDNDACTVNDSCIVGFAMANHRLRRRQPTSETCDPAQGCSVAPKGGPCDDDPCTENDVCGGGIASPALHWNVMTGCPVH